MRVRKRWILLLVLLPALAAPASVPPNLEDALSAQRDLAARNPRDARVLNDLGNLLVLTGRLAEAEQTYAEAVTLAPDNQAIRYNLALVLHQEGLRKRAIKEYKAILELNPNHAWTYYQLGALYESMGRRERAVRHYARALELDPELLSPEVNPHIIENRLVTASLILARWGDSSTAMAPRLYQQPARITDLLVPPLPEPESEDSTDETKSEEDATAAEDDTGEGASRELEEGDLQPTARRPPRDSGPPGSAGEAETEIAPDVEASGDDEDEGEEDEGEGDDTADPERAREQAGGGAGGGEGGGQTLTAEDLVPSFAGQVQPVGRTPSPAPRGGAGSSGGGTTSRGRPVPPAVPPGTVSGGGPPSEPPPGGDPGTGTASTGRLDLRLLPEPGDLLARLDNGDPSGG